MNRHSGVVGRPSTRRFSSSLPSDDVSGTDASNDPLVSALAPKKKPLGRPLAPLSGDLKRDKRRAANRESAKRMLLRRAAKEEALTDQIRQLKLEVEALKNQVAEPRRGLPRADAPQNLIHGLAAPGQQLAGTPSPQLAVSPPADQQLAVDPCACFG